jgi:hypothetical protein
MRQPGNALASQFDLPTAALGSAGFNCDVAKPSDLVKDLARRVRG